MIARANSATTLPKIDLIDLNFYKHIDINSGRFIKYWSLQVNQYRFKQLKVKKDVIYKIGRSDLLKALEFEENIFPINI